MASYVVLRRNEALMGDRDVLAVFVDDGATMAALGGEAYEAFTDDPEGTTPEERLRSVLTGFVGYELDGPIPFDGSTAEVLEPLAKLYGL